MMNASWHRIIKALEEATKLQSNLSVDISDTACIVTAEAPNPAWAGTAFYEYPVKAGHVTISKTSGEWRATQMCVLDPFKGKGLAFDMLRKGVETVGPFHTSRVFSNDGRRQMEGLVRRGWADRLDGGDYLIHF